MTTSNCQCKHSCAGIALIAAIIIGIVAFALTFTATVTVTPAFLWVLFGIAVVYLPVTLLFAATVDNRERRCLCGALTTLLIGILGTILTAIILLGVGFAATSILGAIFVGVLLFFFTLIIAGTACLVKCAADCPFAD